MSVDSHQADEGWFGRRKRIVAHEVQTAPQTPEDATPTHVVVVPAHDPNHPPPPAEVVLDPTLLAERRRSRFQNFAYHVTQWTVGGAMAAAAAAIVCLLMQEPRSALPCAGVAAVLALVSWRLVRLRGLLRRLRGYTAAAMVLTAIAVSSLGIYLIFFENPTPGPGPAHPTTEPAPMGPLS